HKSSWNVLCKETDPSGVTLSDASSRRHCSRGGSSVTCNVSPVGAGLRSLCAEAVATVMRQLIATPILRPDAPTHRETIELPFQWSRVYGFRSLHFRTRRSRNPG